MKENVRANFCFYAFGYSHLFFEKLIANPGFNKKYNNPNFLFLTPNRTHKNFYDKLNYKVFYLSDIKTSSKNEFKYCVNKEIATQKKSIINLNSKSQEQIYYEADVLINKILLINKITHVIFSQAIEGLYGILLANNAKELKIKCFVPHSTRFIGTSFFSNNQYENLEIKNQSVISDDFKKSKKIIENIRTSQEIQRYPTKSKIKKPLFNRLYNFLKKVTTEKKIDLPRLFVSIENNLSQFYLLFYKSRWIISKRFIQIRSYNQLPKKFIFYPLQYTPESSINIPNPYFVDQNRLIDLIRFNMPKDYLLVIKENPNMIGRRNHFFYKNLSKLSGIRLIDHKLNTIKILKESSLVVSVSGTVCLEAYINKIPSIVFGKTFFSDFTNKVKPDFNNLSKTLKNYFKLKITEEEIQKNIALILINTYNFKSGAIDFSPEILKEKNLNSFVKSLPTH